MGGLRNKLETMTNSVTDLDGDAGSAVSSDSGDGNYAVGDKVWITLGGNDIKGVVSEVQSTSVQVRYVDPEGGVAKGFFRFDEVRGRE